MPDNCKHWQAIIAERALTGKASADRELDAHLAGCADCTAASAEFRTTVAALGHANLPANPTTASSSPPTGLETRIMTRLHHAQHQHRTRRNHRMVLVVGGAAAAMILLVVTLGSLRDSTQPTRGEQVALVASPVHGDATLEARAWGTQIHLTGTGFKPGQHYNVWLEQADGIRVPAGTFNGVSNTEITVSLASALPVAEAVAIGISEPDGTLIVRSNLA